MTDKEQGEPFLKLPNGCHLRPGVKVRMERRQAFQIPEEIVEKLGLELDDSAFSHHSEVVVWPLLKQD